MTCPRPDGTYADWCTNIPTTTTSSSTTSSSTTSSTSTTTVPVTTTSIPREPDGDDCTLHGDCHTTSVTTVPPAELPRTGSGDALPGIAAIGLALVLVGARFLYRPARR